MIIKTGSNTINVRILILSLIMASIIGLSACKSNNIEGSYNGYIHAVIENDSLRLYEHQHYAKFLLGKAKVSHLEGNFYTLNSLGLTREPFKNVSIDYVDRQNPDTLYLTIRTPKIHRFIFDVTLNDKYEFKCYNHSDSTKIAIPPKLYRFQIALTPVEYTASSPAENYYGLLRLNDLWHTIDVYDKDVIVTYNDLTLEITDMWYFDNVIVRIDDKGMLFYNYELKKENQMIQKR